MNTNTTTYGWYWTHLFYVGDSTSNGLVYEHNFGTIGLKVYRDGFTELTCSEALNVYDVMKYINVYNILLESKLISLTHDSFLSIESISKKSLWINSKSNNQVLQQLWGESKHVFWNGVHNTISLDIYRSTTADFEKIITDFSQVEMLSTFLKSLELFKNGEFAESIIQGWFVIEQYIWLTYRKKSHKDVVSETDTVLKALQLLSLKHVFSDGIMSKIHTVRKVRNRIVHNGFDSVLLSQEALLALEILQECVLQKTGLLVMLNLRLV